MPVEGGVRGHSGLCLDCEALCFDVGNTVRGRDEIEWRGCYDGLVLVRLTEGDADRGLAGEDLRFTHTVAGEVARSVDREIRSGGVFGQATLESHDFLVQCLNA